MGREANTVPSTASVLIYPYGEIEVQKGQAPEQAGMTIAPPSIDLAWFPSSKVERSGEGTLGVKTYY